MIRMGTLLISSKGEWDLPFLLEFLVLLLELEEEVDEKDEDEAS